MSGFEAEVWTGPKPGFIDRMIEAEAWAENSPKDPGAHVNLAEVYSESMVYTDEAVKSYERAILLSRDMEMARTVAKFCMDRATSPLLNGNERNDTMAAAIRYLYAVAESEDHRHGEDLLCYRLMAKLYDKLGDAKNAEIFRKKARPEGSERVIIKE